MTEAAEIIHLLKRGSTEQKEEAVKAASLYIYDRNYFPEALPLLVELLEQEITPKIAEEAAWALWKFKDSKAIPVLLKKAREAKTVGVREKAIRALGLLEATEALGFLRELAFVNKKEPIFLKASAIAALGYYKDADLIPSLLKLSRHRSIVLRKEALQALGRFLRRDPKVIGKKELKKIKLRDDVRIEALVTLSYSRQEWVKKVLLKALLKDPLVNVRAKSLELLAEWSFEENKNLLIQCCQDKDWKVRFVAAHFLKKSLKKNSHHPILQTIQETFPVIAESPGGFL